MINLDEHLLNNLLQQAESSDRKRVHYNLHNTYDEPVQRVCIALKTGTYVRPHLHIDERKWELLIGLKGSLGVVIFDQKGRVLSKEAITAGGNLSAKQLAPNTYHTVYPITDSAVILEVKQGPYVPTAEGEFAEWAPAENDPASSDFLRWLIEAKLGEQFYS